MNLPVLFLLTLFFAVPLIPLLLEILKREDRGPRKIPDVTINREDSGGKTSFIEKARIASRTKGIAGKVLRVTGDVSIPDGTEINSDIIIEGRLRVGKRCKIHGSVKVYAGLIIGEETLVEGNILSDGEVIIGRGAQVKGIVDSLQNVILEEEAVVEAVSTEKSVKIYPGARINRSILCEASIETVHANAALDKEDEGFLKKGMNEDKIEKVKFIPEIPEEMLNPFIGHLYIFAPNRYGKTFLAKNLIIPYSMMADKRIIVIDPHGEYDFKIIEINYERTIPKVENNLLKAYMLFKICADIDCLVEEIINRIKRTGGNLSVRPNITDNDVKKLVINELIERISRVEWRKPTLLVVEESENYDVAPLILREKNMHLQAILISREAPDNVTFYRTHLVVGKVSSSLLEGYDPKAATAIGALRKYEFIWEKENHEWRRFRLDGQLPLHVGGGLQVNHDGLSRGRRSSLH
ncbi:MAG TPA: hypothetical protein EYP88_05615 [Anaerolineales bacterium]|nr:hypothetical protein [Anaerolineales bacterium]